MALYKSKPHIWGLVSVPAPSEASVERLESDSPLWGRSTNGLKGRWQKNAAPIQCPADLPQSSG
jgi:hypothetical protein